MPAPGAGGVQTSLVGTVQSMMASARRVPPQAATRATTRRARPEPGRRQEQPGRSQPIRRRLRNLAAPTPAAERRSAIPNRGMRRRTAAARQTDTPDARTRRRRRPDLAGRHRARHDGERAPRSAASRHPSNDAARPSRARAATRTTRPISANSPKTSNDLEKFVPWSDLDPVYFDSSYYLYPDGPVAVEMLRVIGAAMAEAQGWLFSLCVPRRRFGRRSSAWPKASSTLRWSRSPRRLSRSGREVSIRRRIEIVTRRPSKN